MVLTVALGDAAQMQFYPPRLPHSLLLFPPGVG